MKILVLLAFACLPFSLIAQETSPVAYVTNDWGWVEDSAFHQLIRTRGYSLTGRFWQDKLQKYAYVQKNNRWGVIDIYGKEVLAPRYDDISHFQYGMAIVTLEGKMGVVTLSGKETVKPQYDRLAFETIYDEEKALLTAALGEKEGMINESGEIKQVFRKPVPQKQVLVEGDAMEAYDDVAVPPDDEGYGYPSSFKRARRNKQGRWGLMEGRDTIYPFVADSIVVLGNNSNFFKVKKGKKWKALHISPKGGERVFTEYDDARLARERFIFQVQRKGKWGLVNSNGKELIPLRYEAIMDDYASRRAAVKLKGRWGIVNMDGKELVPCRYEYLDVYAGPLVIYRAKGLYGLLQSDPPQELTQPLYDTIWRDRLVERHTGKISFIYYMKQGGKTGILNAKGEETVPAAYDSVVAVYTTFIGARKAGKYGALDSLGQVLLPFEYDAVPIPTFYHVLIIQRGATYGLCDPHGHIIEPATHAPFRVSWDEGDKGMLQLNYRNGEKLVVDWY